MSPNSDKHRRYYERNKDAIRKKNALINKRRRDRKKSQSLAEQSVADRSTLALSSALDVENVTEEATGGRPSLNSAHISEDLAKYEDAAEIHMQIEKIADKMDLWIQSFFIDKEDGMGQMRQASLHQLRSARKYGHNLIVELCGILVHPYLTMGCSTRIDVLEKFTLLDQRLSCAITAIDMAYDNRIDGEPPRLHYNHINDNFFGLV
ncbi:hypothetical protein BDN70DRAFT_940057 [Pholiota conissans]|uniref:Uncharacterized protein n=1 Tax=Pholiota conissans TaxID=109636 RepID=A0A9P6CRJ0_9AGAR|nr:hypothetical protein BDN70DRAFT_940057 [Pholiota conissans]